MIVLIINVALQLTMMINGLFIGSTSVIMAAVVTVTVPVTGSCYCCCCCWVLI